MAKLSSLSTLQPSPEALADIHGNRNQVHNNKKERSRIIPFGADRIPYVGKVSEPNVNTQAQVCKKWNTNLRRTLLANQSKTLTDTWRTHCL